MAGSSNGVSTSKNDKASPPPNIAPRVNWPSAPIFHTFALKPKDKPKAIKIRGVALTNNSATPSIVETGSIKKALTARKGSVSISQNITILIINVRKIAISGD